MANPAGLDAFVVGGYFNITAPAPANGQRVPFQVDSQGNLLVNVAVGGGGGGSNASVGLTGANVPLSATYIAADNPGGKLTGLSTDASGNLNVNLANGTISGGNAAAGLTGSPVPTSADYTGFNVAGNLVGVSAANPLPVSQQGTVTVTGSVSITGTPTVDVTDRAVRLLGVVYGSQGQQLKQTATNFNLQVELATGGTLYDARQIRALTSSDVVTVVQPTAANLNATVVFPSAQPVTLTSTTITGTVAVTQSTNPWTVAGTAAVGAAASGNPEQMGGVFNTNPSTITSGQMGALQVTNKQYLLTVLTDNSGHQINIDPNGNLNIDLQQVGGAAITLGAKTSANSIPVVLATDEATLNVSVQNATLAVTQSTSPWVVSGTVTANQGTANATPWNENIAQFGGAATSLGQKTSANSIPVVVASDNVLTVTVNNLQQYVEGTNAGPGASGTVAMGLDPNNLLHSLSLDANRNLKVVSLLPANAAQETGGNLATIAFQTRNDAQINDSLNEILAQMRLLNMNLASCIPSAQVDNDTILLDTFSNIGV